MKFPETFRPSPNFASSPLHEQLGVLFHHSVMSFEATIARMTDPTSRVSYHCLIGADGTRCRLVADENVAWHAGVSAFRGRPHCNEFLLGLAFAGDTYREPLSDAQIASALEWLAVRQWSRRWTLDDMTDHRQVAPGRKDDLNPVEWARLREHLARHFG
jgi:AmpD protein